MGSCLLEHFKAQPLWNLKKYGSWALVTGPTDGIGKAFAFQLARNGLNLILVGWNSDKLKDVSDAVLAKYGKTQIKTIVVDFTGNLDDGVRHILKKIKGLYVGLLINIVGILYPYARFFHEVDSKLLRNLIKSRFFKVGFCSFVFLVFFFHSKL
ncbi:hypothetical protein EV2_002552 [Malus domestica]